MALRKQNPSPFEFCTLTGALLAGILIFATNSVPESLSENVGEIAQIVWGILFTLGALIALIGLSKKNRADGLLVESVGQIMLGAGAGTYAVAVGVTLAAPLNACMFGGFAVACFWRYVQIRIWARTRVED